MPIIPQQYDLFVSYNSADKEQVISLAESLEQAGFRVYLDHQNLLPGRRARQAIEVALNNSGSCAVLLGPNGPGPWQEAEIDLAFNRNISDSSFPVIPVLLPGVDRESDSTLKGLLGRFVWVDFSNGLNDEEELGRLVAGIRSKSSAESNSQPPDLNFAAQLPGRLGDRDQLKALLEWVKRVEFAQGSQSEPQDQDPKADQTFLLIQVKPFDHRNKTFILYYWVLKNGRVVDSSSDDAKSAQGQPFDELEREIEQLAATAQVGYSKPVVEVVLLRELFGCDVTQWSLNDDESFLRQIRVVFRCHDRFDARQKALAAERRGLSLLQSLKGTKVRLKPWQDKCAELRELGGECIEDHLFGILDPGQYEADDLNEKFQKPGVGVLIALGFAPHLDNATGWCKALDYGAPLAVWLREIPDGQQLDEEMLKKLLRNQDQAAVSLAELPDHIWQLQKSAIKGKDKNDPKYHLTLLYDDYDRVPSPP